MAYLNAAMGARREAGAGSVLAADIADGAVTRSKESAPAGRRSVVTAPVTVATTSNTDTYVVVPEAGTLDSVDFSGIDALAQHGSNYVTFSITNLGQAGAGSAAMLAATDANTSKTTTGAAISANTKRSLTLTSTGADLVVAAGDRLRIRVAATGTLANTVAGSVFTLRFSGTT